MDAFIGEIRPVSFNFNPWEWALCNGQLLSVQAYTPLFSLIGTTYGGDGINYFGLPNLQGRIVTGNGNGPGLSPYGLGDQGGASTVTLTAQTMGGHGHTLPVSPIPGSGSATPSPSTILGGNPEPRKSSTSFYVTPQTQSTTVAAMGNVVGSAGGDQPHNNMGPFVAIQYIIALSGLWPQRP